jgi:serine/threonine protein kinase
LNVAAEILAEQQAESKLKRIGAYEILSQIGAGGMGEVYLAEDARLKRRIAAERLS